MGGEEEKIVKSEEKPGEGKVETEITVRDVEKGSNGNIANVSPLDSHLKIPESERENVSKIPISERENAHAPVEVEKRREVKRDPMLGTVIKDGRKHVIIRDEAWHAFASLKDRGMDIMSEAEYRWEEGAPQREYDAKMRELKNINAEIEVEIAKQQKTILDQNKINLLLGRPLRPTPWLEPPPSEEESGEEGGREEEEEASEDDYEESDYDDLDDK